MNQPLITAELYQFVALRAMGLLTREQRTVILDETLDLVLTGRVPQMQRTFTVFDPRGDAPES